jgi:hypothetical protein
MLRINVTTAEAVVSETELITAGRKGLRCAFSFNSAWDGLAKTAVIQGVVTRDIALLGGSEVTVPAECLTKPNFPLRIGVYGAKADGSIAIPTIWASFGKILPGVKPSDIPPDELTPDVVAQIQEAANNALYLARNVQSMADSGALDGVSPTISSASITGGHRLTIVDAGGTTTVDVMDGEDGEDAVSPTVTSESITGGHRLTITDADGVTTVDVMDGQDGQDGQDAVVDPTLSNAGEAADAKATGDELYRHRLELTALSPEIGADAYSWNLRKNYNSSGSYVTVDGFGITSTYIPVQHGARVQNTAPEKDGNGKTTAMHINEFAGTTWLRRTILASGKYMSIGADTTSIRIAYGYASSQDVTITQELIDATFSVRIIQQPASGSGGSGITVDDALSGSSTNPVQNKVIKAALDVKGTYSKPSGGIPSSDLASAVQTSLGKADTALQSAPVTSVNGQTGAVVLSIPDGADEITWTGGNLGQQTPPAVVEGAVQAVYDAIPSTASDVGAVAVAQGVAHAGEFVVVGSDGNITTVTMSVWQGGSF